MVRRSARRARVLRFGRRSPSLATTQQADRYLPVPCEEDGKLVVRPANRVLKIPDDLPAQVFSGQPSITQVVIELCPTFYAALQLAGTIRKCNVESCIGQLQKVWLTEQQATELIKWLLRAKKHEPSLQQQGHRKSLLAGLQIRSAAGRQIFNISSICLLQGNINADANNNLGTVAAGHELNQNPTELLFADN